MKKTLLSRISDYKLLPYLGLACTSLFWAGNAIVARGFNTEIGPLALAFHRWLVCALLVSPFIVRAIYRHRHLLIQSWHRVLVLAFLSVTTFNSLLYMAAQHTTALNITLVNSLLPITTLLLAIPLFRQRISVKNGLGVAVAFAGALYVILQGDIMQLWALGVNRGDITMAIAMLVWSVYSLLLRKWALPIPGFDLFAILTGLGLLVLLPFYYWEYQVIGGFIWTPDLTMVILYVAVFPSLLAYLFWNYGVTQTSPSIAAMYAYLTPLITALLAVPLLGENPHSYHVTGGLAILVGLWLSHDIGQNKEVRLRRDDAE